MRAERKFKRITGREIVGDRMVITLECGHSHANDRPHTWKKLIGQHGTKCFNCQGDG